MDVVALVPGRDHVCTRYRVLQYERHLAAVGLQLRLEPLGDTPGARFQQLTRPRPHSVVLLVRKLLPLWQLTLLRRSARALVYDFDDAVYLRDSFHPRGPYSVTRWVRFATVVRWADQVVAGNEFLAQEARQQVAARHANKICVIPTSVDANRYTIARHQDAERIRLVWIGSASTLRTLEDARDVLETVGQQIPNTVLRVICNQFPRFRHLAVEPRPWSQATECPALAHADIGISWIRDDAWGRGKCGLKIIQYLAAGLPVVTTPVGVHRAILPESAGFFADRPEDWVAQIRTLACQPQLRRSMGRLGREHMERHFHVDRWGPILAERLHQVATRL